MGFCFNSLMVITLYSQMIGFSSTDEVPELEDEQFASKIEVLFADIPVIAKYRKNLVNLKWVHTAWNGNSIIILILCIVYSKATYFFTQLNKIKSSLYIYLHNHDIFSQVKTFFNTTITCSVKSKHLLTQPLHVQSSQYIY